MKAVAYYEKYRERLNNPLEQRRNEALSEMMMDLCHEIGEIAAKRGAKRDSAVFSIFKEVNLKYNAIAKMINAEGKVELLRNGFGRFVKMQMPKLAEMPQFKEWSVEL